MQAPTRTVRCIARNASSSLLYRLLSLPFLAEMSPPLGNPRCSRLVGVHPLGLQHLLFLYQFSCLFPNQAASSLEARAGAQKTLSPHCPAGYRRSSSNICQTSLVDQWLRIRLPTQGTRGSSLVWEDSTCQWSNKAQCTSTTEVRGISSPRAAATEACGTPEPVLCNKTSRCNGKLAHH